MGPTKAIVKGDALYEAQTGKLIQAGLDSYRAIDEYSSHHYIVVPERDKKGRFWEFDGKPVYCLRGSKYELLDGTPLHGARCPDCGGLAVRIEEMTVESDCLRCTQCEHEFDTRLEMMEN
jgi:hypothetical protein